MSVGRLARIWSQNVLALLPATVLEGVFGVLVEGAESGLDVFDPLRLLEVGLVLAGDLELLATALVLGGRERLGLRDRVLGLLAVLAARVDLVREPLERLEHALEARDGVVVPLLLDEDLTLLVDPLHLDASLLDPGEALLGDRADGVAVLALAVADDPAAALELDLRLDVQRVELVGALEVVVQPRGTGARSREPCPS